jgi:alkane 1-monooxygenase
MGWSEEKRSPLRRAMPVHPEFKPPLGRILLLELTRHSDHHYQASRKYQILRHFDESPQMPGCPGMVLAFIPPLWFGVMQRDRALLQQPTSIDLA